MPEEDFDMKRTVLIGLLTLLLGPAIAGCNSTRETPAQRAADQQENIQQRGVD
jgi:hypothetical protein